MIVLNFGHQLTERQCATIEELAREKMSQPPIWEEATFDHNELFVDEVAKLVSNVALDNAAWQSKRILVVPPSFAPGAVILIAYLHGLMGDFPELVRIRPSTTTTGDRYEVAEIVDLQQHARKRGRDAR